MNTTRPKVEAEEESSLPGGIKDALKDTMKKVVLTGVGTIFLTEETVRSLLGELKLPKELWAGMISNAAKTKQDFLNAFAKEVAGVVSQIDIAGEARKFFEGHKIKVSIEMAFDKNETSVKAEKK